MIRCCYMHNDWWLKITQRIKETSDEFITKKTTVHVFNELFLFARVHAPPERVVTTVRQIAMPISSRFYCVPLFFVVMERRVAVQAIEHRTESSSNSSDRSNIDVSMVICWARESGQT